MVMTATPSSTAVRTSSATSALPSVGYLRARGYFGWNLMPPSKRMTSAFM
jgi:hypothetical protein